MEDRAAVAGLDSGDRRQIIGDAGGDQQKPGRFLGAIGERHAKALVTPASVGHADRAELDAVGHELLASQRVEREGRDAVAREVAVQRLGVPVARLPRVAEQHPPPAPPEHQGGAQARRPASDDDDIEHCATSGCKTVTRTAQV